MSSVQFCGDFFKNFHESDGMGQFSSICSKKKFVVAFQSSQAHSPVTRHRPPCERHQLLDSDVLIIVKERLPNLSVMVLVGYQYFELLKKCRKYFSFNNFSPMSLLKIELFRQNDNFFREISYFV